MITMCLGCAVLAAWLAIPASPTRVIRNRLASAALATATDATHGEGQRRRRRSWIYCAIMIILLFVIIASGHLAKAKGAVLASAILLVGVTATRLVVQYRRRRTALRVRAEIARACAALASYLRVGQVPSAALAIAAADCEVLREGHQTRTLGGDVVQVWRLQARREGHSGLLELARAWQVSTESGAPMSSTLDQVATSLAADQALTQVVNSGRPLPARLEKVMAILPGRGLGIGTCLQGTRRAACRLAPLAGMPLGRGSPGPRGALRIEALARQVSTEV